MALDMERPDEAEVEDHEQEADERGHLGALKSCREACLRCVGSQSGDNRRTASALVATCENAPCPLWAFRHGRKPDAAKLDRSTPLLPPERGVNLGYVLDHPRQRRMAIRLQCLECVGYERREIAACTTWSCALYPYRLGPSHPRDGGDVSERRALWRRIGHDAYVRAMNATLCAGESDGEPVKR